MFGTFFLRVDARRARTSSDFFGIFMYDKLQYFLFRLEFCSSRQNFIIEVTPLRCLEQIPLRNFAFVFSKSISDTHSFNFFS